MIDFAFRNLTLFFKDRTAVLLSFLAEFIVVGLYILFIRKNMIESFSQVENIEILMDVWMSAGILGITSVTTTMGAYGIMVDDKTKRINKDFATSPIRRFSLLGGYMSGAVVIGLFMSVFLFLVSAVYILHKYQVQLGDGQGIKLFMLLGLVTISNSSMVLFIVSFLKSSNALASCCTILGALIGFLTGIYLPMGNLPDGVQWLVKCFPVSHGVVLLRQILMEPLIKDVFGNVESNAAKAFMDFMGVRYLWDGVTVTFVDSMLILGIATCVFFAITIIKIYYFKE